VPTQALAAYGIELRMSNGIPPAPLTILFASATSPITINTGAHGYPVGEVVWMNVTGAVGDPGMNGSWIAEATGTTNFELRASITAGTYSGGGIAQARGTFTRVAELVNIAPIGVSFNMVDASAHDGNGWGTSIPTRKRGVDARVEINLVPAHPTHDHLTGLQFLNLGKIRRDWMIVLPDTGKSVVAFQAWVSDEGTMAPTDGVLRANPILSIDGAMVFAMGAP
jgi:hypothetical protein